MVSTTAIPSVVKGEAPKTKFHIVDSDAHTYNPKDMWERYLPQKFQSVRPQLVHDHAGGDAWQMGPDVAPMQLGLTFTAGMKYEDFKWYGMTYDDIRPGCYDGNARLDDMDLDGVDAQILYSDNRPMSYFMRHPDPEFQLAAVQGYNNWLVEEFCSPDPSRLIGLAQIPNLGVDAAIAELRRNKERGVKGVIIRSWPSGGARISPEDDPFWAACEELEMPVTNHGFAVSMDVLRSGKRFEGPVDALNMPGIDITTCIVQLMASGVHDRFPNLKFGAIETQAGWVPWLLEQMDDKYFRNRIWGEVNLKYLPSEYWLTNWFVTFIIDQYGVHNRDFIGVDTMMWSSDYPHHGNDWPYSRKVIQSLFSGVSDEDKHKITCDNAVRIFHLD
jgi:predicted TIM-barrel fold metal-dependent hydrolase